MTRNIVVYSDGTGQDGGVRPDQRLSNVYKLYRATRIGPDSSINPSEQIAFYDPGLGTEGDAHGIFKVRRTLEKLLASVMGRGIGHNIADCYEFIINHWKPGDRLFIIGFSRGAYTARCLAQVLALCGVPQHAPGNPSAPFRKFSREARQAAERAVHQVYEHGAGHPRGDFEDEREELARRFRTEFGSNENGAPNAHPHFIGVFDTVAALGASGPKYAGILAGLILLGGSAIALPVGLLSLIFGFRFFLWFSVVAVVVGLIAWTVIDADSIRTIKNFKGVKSKSHRIRWRAENYDRGLSRRVEYARQASAIDENREDFPRVPWGRNTVIREQKGNEPPPLVQLYFAGNHSDIGGSYPEEESRLSDIALSWMVDEATTIPGPLIVDRTRLSLWPDATGVQHCEVSSSRDKLSWIPRWVPGRFKNGWPVHARTVAGFPVHPSVFERFAQPSVAQPSGDGPYRPETLTDDERFAGYFVKPQTERPDLLAAVFQLVNNNSAQGTLEALKLELCRLLADASESGAAIVILPSNTVEKNDAYRDTLALRHLDGLIERAGLVAFSANCVVPGTPEEWLPGRIVLAASIDQATTIAASIGQTEIIEVTADGSVTARASLDCTEAD